MLGGVKKVNYFMVFEITLMQRAMIQASYIVLCCVIVINTLLSCSLDSCNNYDFYHNEAIHQSTVLYDNYNTTV